MSYSVKIRKLILDNHLGIEDPRFYKKLNIKKIVEVWSKSHIELVWIDFNDLFGNSYYNTNVGHKFTPLGKRDQMKEMLAEFKKRKMGVWASYAVCWQSRHSQEHPDWMQRGKDGVLSEYGCPNSPFGEYVLAQLKEIVKNYDIDGVFLDMGFFLGDRYNCYCDYCNRKFKKKFGITIPKEPDWKSDLWRSFIKWKYDGLYNFLKECVETIKKIKDLPVESQWTADWIYPGTKHGQSIRSAELFDLIGHDIYERREGLIDFTLLPKFYRSIKGGKPYLYECHIGRMMGDLSIWSVKPSAHLAAQVYTAIANGASTVIIDQIHPEGYVEEEPYGVISEIYSEVEKREEWLLDIESSPLHKYACVYFSEGTRDFYGRENPAKYVLSFQGVCKALLECHIPFEIIVDRQMNLKDLSQYKVLVLSNVAILSEKESDAIQQFVKQGGGLVATYETSLYDESGNLKNNFRLSNLLHIDYLGDSPYSHNFLKKVVNHPVVDCLRSLPIQISDMRPEEGSFTLKVKSSNDAEVLAKVIFPYIEHNRDGKRISHNNPPGVHTDFPAIVCSKYGKGKVVYFAYQPDAVYAVSSYPEHKMLITNALKWAGGVKVPLEIEAPISVEGIIWHQPHRNRFIVHLLNYVTEMGRSVRTPGIAQIWHTVIEEILPVYDVKLKVKMGEYKAKVVHTVPDLQKLEYTISDGYLKITIPKIGIWTMIAIEY